MSGTFSGFSEEDIKKAQNGFPINKTIDNALKIKMGTKSKKTPRPIVRFDESRNTTTNIDDIIEIPEEAKLSKETVGIEIESNIEVEKERDEVNSNENIQVDDDDSKNDNIVERKVFDLDEKQARQKLMEEQNRRRKELLTKALAEKKKRTQEEVQKLNKVQGELKKLDALLSNDVKLLRRKIEIASIQYMEAQKRYLKIEKEFLEARLGLQQNLEKKELLTEHLCTIIEKNEERKAEKLTELLNKLELEYVDDTEIANKETIETT